jgi:hypothetical protein
MDKVNARFPTRNYNRAIRKPSKDKNADEIELYPKGMKSLITAFRERVGDVVQEIETQIQKEQEKVEGFLEVAEQKKKNKERVMKVIAENKDIHEIESRVAKLCESLDIDLNGHDDKKER